MVYRMARHQCRWIWDLPCERPNWSVPVVPTQATPALPLVPLAFGGLFLTLQDPVLLKIEIPVRLEAMRAHTRRASGRHSRGLICTILGTASRSRGLHEATVRVAIDATDLLEPMSNLREYLNER
jgi:hypothetical protein